VAVGVTAAEPPRQTR